MSRERWGQPVQKCVFVLQVNVYDCGLDSEFRIPAFMHHDHGHLWSNSVCDRLPLSWHGKTLHFQQSTFDYSTRSSSRLPEWILIKPNARSLDPRRRIPIESYRPTVLFFPVGKDTGQTMQGHPTIPFVANISWWAASLLSRLPDLAADSFSPRRATSTEPRTDDRQ